MKFLVPVDGSQSSLNALKKAAELAKQRNAKLLLLTVVNNLVDNPYILDQDYSSEISQKNIRHGEKILEEALKTIDDFPKENVSTMLRNGEIAETIIEIAEDDGYDLIVMGRRGQNQQARSLLGSVSNKVLNFANKSVLVIK